jgi:N-acetylmuramoyl-L-alanine amidase
MWVRRIIALTLIGLVLSGQAGAMPAATEVRVTGAEGSARVVIDVSEPVKFHVFTLQNPDRVVVDLKDAVWRLLARPDRGAGPVRRVRTGQFNDDDARLVLDLTGPVLVREAFMMAATGTHIVVVLGATRGGAMAAMAVAPPVPLPEEPAPVLNPPALVGTVPPPLPGTKPARSLAIVVIDAGHGGDDPGAIATNGKHEKDLTLAAARDLRDALEASGRFTVYLTREDDRFLSLVERVEVARARGAELFISLHCDALDDASVRGATIYTVSETASDAEAQSFAAKENSSDAKFGADLIAASYDPETAEILIDLTRRDTMNASSRFAALLGAEVGRVATLRRNSHRYAGFRVLKAPDVPSVLFEMGYLSNKKDLAMLATPKERRKLMASVARAIERYFERVTAFQAP